MIGWFLKRRKAKKRGNSKLPPVSHAFTYKHRRFRSGWEVAYAKWLDDLGIAWRYECETFRLSNGQFYTPDFYLPTMDTWVEIKGEMTKDAKKKIKRFRKEYKHITLEILDGKKLKEIGVL